MKKIFALIALGALCAAPLSAQEKAKRFEPAAGDFSVGVTFNPVALAGRLPARPQAGDFARASLGLNGSRVNYREYVQDDIAVTANPESKNQVVDEVHSAMDAVTIGLGLEWSKGHGPLRFNLGVGLQYAIAGGSMDFKYGNILNNEHQIPSTMPMLTQGTQKTLNEGDPIAGENGIVWARPLKRYNVGHTNGIGLTLDMGLEWFFFDRISLAAAATFTPVMFCFQPQTYTVYEGWSTLTDKVEQFNQMVSPGSTALLYGTENLGCRFSINYYF